MRPTQFLRLREVEHHITLHALIHSYSKLSNADVMSIKLIVVGVTTTTAEAFIRDILRTNKVPANIQAVGMDSDLQDLNSCQHADYCFFLSDLAVVEKAVFYDLLAKVLISTKGDRVKFMLHGKIADAFHTAMYEAWVAGLLRTSVMEWDIKLASTQVGIFHKLDRNEVLTNGALPEVGALDTIFFDQSFADVNPEYLCRLMATNQKCKYIMHPHVARTVFVHLTYGHDANSFVLNQ